MKKILVTGLLILGVASFSYAATSTSLRIGTTGEEVSVLQQNLRSAGISVAVTGSYDQKTAEAVKKFQLSQGLVADGIAGKTTRAKLTSTTTKTAPTTTNNIVPGGNTGTPWATICDDGLPHLQVLTPNGGEVYNAGDQIKVTWRTCNIAAEEPIYLGFDTTFPVTAFGVANVAQTNTGSGILIAQPSWFVPGGFQSGKYYKAFVYSDTATDNSNVTFTIKGTPWTQTDVCPNISGIQTTVPTGYILLGGQCVPGGTTSGSPTITTNAYSNLDVANGNIRFNGTFISNGSATTTYFEYQTVGGSIVRRPGINQGSTQIGSFNDDVINLTTANYQYRACGFNSYGTNCGDWIGFSINRSTSTQLPMAQTLSPITINSNSAIVDGYFNVFDTPGSSYYEWGTSNASLTNQTVPTTRLAGTSGSMSFMLSGLQPNTTYYYKAVVQNTVGTVKGEIKMFMTSSTTGSVDVCPNLAGVQTTVPTGYVLSGGQCMQVPIVTYQCNDGRDNDGDGLKDYPQDPGCASASDDDEYNLNSSSVTCEAKVPALIVSYENTSASGPIYGNQSQLQDMGRFVLHARCDLRINRIGISNETSITTGTTIPIFTQNTILDGYGNSVSSLPALGSGPGFAMSGYDPISLTSPITMMAGSTRMITVAGTANANNYNQIRGKKSKASIQIYNQDVVSLKDNKTLNQYTYSSWNLAPYYTERIVGWYTPANEQIVQ